MDEVFLLTMDEGVLSSGSFVEGKLHGPGGYQEWEGFRFEGSFRCRGEWNHGKLTFPPGHAKYQELEYEGSFVKRGGKDLRHGFGKITFANGSDRVLEGNWCNGQPHVAFFLSFLCSCFCGSKLNFKRGMGGIGSQKSIYLKGPIIAGNRRVKASKSMAAIRSLVERGRKVVDTVILLFWTGSTFRGERRTPVGFS